MAHEMTESKEHVLPVATYLKVYGALIVLTYITVQVSLLDLASAAIYVAMAVAAIKAVLVIAYFMHLKFDDRVNAFVFLSSLLFLGIFFALTMIDLGSRDSVVDEEGNFALRDSNAAASAMPAPAPQPSASAKP